MGSRAWDGVEWEHGGKGKVRNGRRTTHILNLNMRSSNFLLQTPNQPFLCYSAWLRHHVLYLWLILEWASCWARTIHFLLLFLCDFGICGGSGVGAQWRWWQWQWRWRATRYQFSQVFNSAGLGVVGDKSLCGCPSMLSRRHGANVSNTPHFRSVLARQPHLKL